MAKYKPGTMNDYAVMRRRRRKTQRQAENANMPTGSNVYETTSKVKDSQNEAIDLRDAVEAMGEALSDLVDAMTAPGACAVTTGQPPQLPGTWVKIGTFEASRSQGDEESARTLTAYERIEDDGDD